MENPIPVNIPGGIPTILDGAGAIKDVVSEDTVKSMEEKMAEYETEKPKMEAIDVKEFMRKMRTKPLVRDYLKIGRNDPCPCGAVDENGKPKKYKKCCLASGKYESMHQVGD